MIFSLHQTALESLRAVEPAHHATMMATLGPAQKTNVDLGTRKRKALSDIGNDNNGDYPDGDSALLDKRSPAVPKRKKTQRVITKDAPQAIEMTKKGRKKKVCAIPDCPSIVMSGGHCIKHGGGRRCQCDGCSKSAVNGMSLCQ